MELGRRNRPGVTDSAGNSYTELLHFKASDKTEMSVWTAPITDGRGDSSDDHGQTHGQGRRRVRRA